MQAEEEITDAEAPKTRNKPTKAEKEKRVLDVQDVLLMGLRPKEIWRYLAEKKKLEVSQRTVDRYIAEATEQIIAAAETHREYELGRAKKRLDHLYQRNIAIQDFKAALAVVRETNELLGLRAPQQVDLTMADKTIIVKLIKDE